MDDQTYLSSFPHLEEWYFNHGSQDFDNVILFKVCKALLTSNLTKLIDRLCFILNTINQLDDASEELVQLESATSSFGLSLPDLLVHISEQSIHQNIETPLLHSTFSNIARKTATPTYCFLAAWICLNTGNYEGVIQNCKLSSTKNSDFFGIMGQAYLEMRNFKQALQNLELATEHAPLDPLHWFWLAKCLFSMEQIEEAGHAALHCFKLVPDNIEAAVLVSIVLEDTSCIHILKDAWNEVVEHIQSEDSINGYIVNVLLSIAIKLKDKSKIQEAINTAEPLHIQKCSLLRENCFKFIEDLNTLDIKGSGEALLQKLISATQVETL